MTDNRPKNDNTNRIFRITIKLFTVCAIAAIILGVTNAIVEPGIRIKEQSIRKNALDGLIAKGSAGEKREIANPTVRALYPVFDESKKTITGYVLELVLKGYGEEISLLMLYKPTGEIVDGIILEPDEKTGSTNKAERPDFLSPFFGKGGSIDTPLLLTEQTSGTGQSNRNNNEPHTDNSDIGEVFIDRMFGKKNQASSVTRVSKTISMQSLSETLFSGSEYIKKNETMLESLYFPKTETDQGKSETDEKDKNGPAPGAGNQDKPGDRNEKLSTGNESAGSPAGDQSKEKTDD
jgi:hypothetical protein